MTLFFKNGKPFVEGVCLNDLTTTIETPFYIYSQKSIIDAYNNIKKSLNTEIFFSIKANSNQAILSLMKLLGAGADVVSAGELERALCAGIEPNKIIFEGVGKSKNDLEYAIKNKIRQINIESMDELILIENLGKSLECKVNVGLRLNPDVDGQTLDKISTGRKTDKFGIIFDLLPDIFSQLKTLKHLNLKGISCHIGSQIHNLDVFEKVFSKMKNAIKILEDYDLKIDFLDLGGGFSVNYNNEKETDLNKLSILIKKIFNNTKYDISFEPGRYLVASAGIIVTKILTSKTNGFINYLITDAGMQTLLRPALYNAFHKIVPLQQNNNIKKYTIAGPICESSDILAKNIKMSEQKTGNYLAVCDTGAYGFVMASNYNTKSLPTEILIYNDSYAIIRNQEKISELIEKDIIPNWL